MRKEGDRHRGGASGVLRECARSDRFLRVSIVDIGGAAGAVGGMNDDGKDPHVLEAFVTYTPIFMVAGSDYLHLSSPRPGRTRAIRSMA